MKHTLSLVYPICYGTLLLSNDALRLAMTLTFPFTRYIPSSSNAEKQNNNHSEVKKIYKRRKSLLLCFGIDMYYILAHYAQDSCMQYMYIHVCHRPTEIWICYMYKASCITAQVITRDCLFLTT